MIKYLKGASNILIYSYTFFTIPQEIKVVVKKKKSGVQTPEELKTGSGELRKLSGRAPLGLLRDE
jgi:hypothetical protein